MQFYKFETSFLQNSIVVSYNYANAITIGFHTLATLYIHLPYTALQGRSDSVYLAGGLVERGKAPYEGGGGEIS